MVQPSGQKLQIWLMRFLKSRRNILLKESLIFHGNIQRRLKREKKLIHKIPKTLKLEIIFDSI